ncbi:hypothetical protein CDL12_17117 [Handroanthus impetiginosus]|uniref:Uncharacterized protein n=1 Tax=Handroanthus impetiginosus TaxID=429701 RepID=A0A2G9GZ55_9LAMI|nr:hypothetical protein CDL12_17117 [Handroanthus impetiginosus]
MEPKTLPKESQLQSQCSMPSSSSSSAQLWRLATQRNLKNYSHRYMDGTDFGVLSDMPNIREKACYKLFIQQELYRGKLLSSYRKMKAYYSPMLYNLIEHVSAYFSHKPFPSNFMRDFFCYYLPQLISKDDSDKGNCGGILVFKFHSIASFELAWEVVRMFIVELNLKLLVMEFLSICYEKVAKVNRLQVYLTTWLAEVNIDRYRMDDIFATVEEEMRFNFLETSG